MRPNVTAHATALLLALLLAGCGDAANGRDRASEPNRRDADDSARATPDRTRESGATIPHSSGEHEGDDVVLFLGTSLTAGYGLDPALAFPALIQTEIDRAGLPFRVVDAGVSGETSAGGLRRLDWAMRDRVAALVLELGANDGLRGLDLQQMRDNLTGIIQRTRARWPDADIILAGMEAPPNFGADYTNAFREVFPAVARGQAATLIPFLLQDVAGEPSLNQADRIHPNAAGHRIIAGTVWKTLAPILRQGADRPPGR